MTIEIGRLCVKLAGRDAGRECLIVEELKNNLVLIDGNTRRRKCNLSHLEFLPKKAEIKKGAEHKEVMAALEKLGIKALERGEKFPKKEKPKNISEQAVSSRDRGERKSILSKIVKKAKPEKKAAEKK